MRQVMVFLSLCAAILGSGCDGCLLGCEELCEDGVETRFVVDTVDEEVIDYVLYEGENERIIGRKMVDGAGDVVDNSRYPSGEVVVIRVGTQDFPPNEAADEAYIEEIFFSDQAGVRSVAGYFAENSLDQFRVYNAGIPSWITLVDDLEDYGAIEADADFVREAVETASVDWDLLDTDGDGDLSRAEVQIVLLIANRSPSTGYASVRNMDVGTRSTPQGEFGFGTRPIVFFRVKRASLPDHASDPIQYHSSVCHEMAHAFFNLPDRYGGGEYVSGTGMYDIMAADQHWLHLTLYDKMKIGWVRPAFIDTHLGSCLWLDAIESRHSGLALIEPESMRSEEGPFEYWLVENRYPAESIAGYDDALPDQGLAVWYVQEGTWAGDDNVRLVQANATPRAGPEYETPGSGALFGVDGDDPTHALLDQDGQWTLLYFSGVSDAGPIVYAEF